MTANRTSVTEGDRVIPLAGIWRTERFADDEQQAKLQALSDAIDTATAYENGDHEALEYTLVPKGVPAAEFDGDQRDLLRALLSTYFDRVPGSVSPRSRYDDDAAPRRRPLRVGRTDRQR